MPLVKGEILAAQMTRCLVETGGSATPVSSMCTQHNLLNNYLVAFNASEKEEIRRKKEIDMGEGKIKKILLHLIYA